MCTGNCTEGSSRTVMFNEVEHYSEDHGPCEARSARRAQCIPSSPQKLRTAPEPRRTFVVTALGHEETQCRLLQRNQEHGGPRPRNVLMFTRRAVPAGDGIRRLVGPPYQRSMLCGVSDLDSRFDSRNRRHSGRLLCWNCRLRSKPRIRHRCSPWALSFRPLRPCRRRSTGGCRPH